MLLKQLSTRYSPFLVQIVSEMLRFDEQARSTYAQLNAKLQPYQGQIR